MAPVTLRFGMEIRAATPMDAPGLATLLTDAGQDADGAALARRLAALRQGGTALIASQWGPPSGLILLHWYATLDEDRPTAQVTTLVVAPEERRRGIGRLLLKAAAQAARAAGCGRMELLAAPGDAALMQFCQATGFVESGLRHVRSLHRQRS